MNYLCKYKDTGELFVISKSSKILELGKTISFGGRFFTALQEIEIR